MTPEYDADNEQWQLKIIGTNLETLGEENECPEKTESNPVPELEDNSNNGNNEVSE